MANSLENFYHDNIDDWNSSYGNISTNDNKLTILQWNVRGINNVAKFDEILQTVDNCAVPIDVLVIGETWLKSSNCSIYQIPHYNAIFSCRNESNGGLTLYIKENIAYRVISNTNNSGLHHIHTELQIRGRPYDIHGFYRPPNFDFSEFSISLEGILASVPPRHSCFMFGDMNVPINHSNNNVALRYKSLLESYGFVCTNTFPTRPASGNILDHVLCRLDDTCAVRNDTIFSDLSDHLQIISSIELGVSKENMTLEKKIVDHQKLKYDFKRFVDNIDDIDCPDLTLNNIIAYYNSLLTKHTKIIKKNVKLKNTQCPWMTFDVWTLVKIKNNYLKLSKLSPNDEHIRQMLRHISKKVEIKKKKMQTNVS